LSKIKRRDFIKYLGVGIVGTVAVVELSDKLLNLDAVKPQEEVKKMYPPPIVNADFAMMIDVGACIGCRRCLHACKLENNSPDAPSNIEWIDLFEMKNLRPVTEVEGIPPKDSVKNYTDAPKKGFWYLSFNCFHCEDPPCTKVCPTGATYKDSDGLVLINYDKCIGCRFCLAACPYNARHFNWWSPTNPPSRISPIDGSVVPLNPLVPLRPKGVAEKCTFCVHRVRKGGIPRCVEVCPKRARHFGDLNDPKSEVSILLDTVRTHRLREDLNTKPMLYYFTRGVKWTNDGEKI